MLRSKTYEYQIGLCLTILLASLFVWFHYAEIIENRSAPKCTDPNRDGIKTFLNASWHARFSPDATRFNGMNYPYAEHIVAATEHPGLAILLRWLHPVFPNLHEHVFGIHHLLLLGCMVLSAVFMYLIFKTLKIPAWYAVLAALGITFLAPQQLRFMFHLGLAPLCVLPAIMYGLLVFQKNRANAVVPWWKNWAQLRTSSLIALAVAISALFHFYFFAITIFCLAAYFFFDLMAGFSWKRLQENLPFVGIMAGLPGIFFGIWLSRFDPVSDRAEYPFGFIAHRAKWESLFTSLDFPLYQWIHTQVVKIEETNFEGWSYIGMVAGLFVAVAAIRWATGLGRRPLLDFLPAEQRSFLMPLLLAGVLLALLACAQPFANKGWEWLLDYAGPLRQFRSTGRFAWVFYYAINVVAVTGFYCLFANIRRGWLRTACLLLPVSILLYEAWVFNHRSEHTFRSGKLQEVQSLKPGSRFTDLTDIDFSKYQAILPLPYFNVGSDNFGMTGGAFAVRESLALSHQTGLPVTGAMLTRSSIRQTFDQLQLVTEPYRKPRIFQDYPNQKPLLVLVASHFSKQDSAGIQHFFEESVFLDSCERWQLWEADLGSFERRIERRKQAIRDEIAAGRLFRQGPFLTSDSVARFVYEGFEKSPSKSPYLGNGAFEGPLAGENTVFQGQLPNAQPGAEYELSFWMYAAEDKYSQSVITIKELGANGQQLQDFTFGVMFRIQVFDPNGWVLVKDVFKPKAADSQWVVTVKNGTKNPKRLFLDELLIRPAGSRIYQQTDSLLWCNNRHWQW